MDDPEGVRWLSYDELAEYRGITRASAKRLSFRHGWKRIEGNDQTSRVAVPVTALETPAARTGDVHETASETTAASTPEVSSTIISALERVMTLLREQMELTSRMSVELVEERQRRGAAEGNMAGLQRQLAELERDLQTANEAANAVAGPVPMSLSEVEAGERARIPEAERERAKEQARAADVERLGTIEALLKLQGQGLFARLLNGKR